MIGRILRLLAALVLVNALLLAPRWIVPGAEEASWIALEAAFVVGLFLVLPERRWSRTAAFAASAAIVLVSIVELADSAARMVLARPLNLYVDYPLARAVLNLMTGSVGTPLSVIVLAVAIVGALGVTWAVRHLLSPRGRPSVLAVLAGLVLMLPLVASAARGRLPALPVPSISARVATPAVDLVIDQTEQLRATLRGKEEFAADLARAPASYATIDGLLGRLDGRDVVLAFVESYGVTTLDTPDYASVIVPRLEDMERRVDDAGLYMASGTLVAPTQGGESWYAHGSMLSGLWLADQIRYDLMLASGRETLIDDFRRAGHRTVAVMPAITYAWPDGDRFGYDRIYAWRDIPYAGPPLNWVTMPDQFVWSFLEHRIVHPLGEDGEANGGDDPVFVEIGLISSHAPWTPILPVLDDWDSVRDGSVFQPWENAGQRPEIMWLDTDAVREHYAESVDYALNAMTGYAERYLDDRTLLIALGDHQPAPLVSGDGAPWSVPVHVISGDPDLIQPFVEWGFRPGAMPSRDHPDRGMDYFRDWFVHAYSAPTPAKVGEEPVEDGHASAR